MWSGSTLSLNFKEVPKCLLYVPKINQQCNSHSHHHWWLNSYMCVAKIYKWFSDPYIWKVSQNARHLSVIPTHNYPCFPHRKQWTRPVNYRNSYSDYEPGWKLTSTVWFWRLNSISSFHKWFQAERSLKFCFASYSFQ